MAYSRKAWMTIQFAILLFASSISRGETYERNLETPIGHFDVDARTRVDAALTLAALQKIPLGIEYAGPKLFEPVTIHIRNTTAEGVLETIFPRRSGFRISMDNGVPVVTDKAFPERNSGVMTVTLSHFSLLNKSSLQMADALLKIELYQQLNPEATQGYGGSISGGGPAQVGPFDLTHITVRKALDRIISDRGQAAWIAQVSPEMLSQKVSPIITRKLMTGDSVFWTVVEYDSILAQRIGTLTEKNVVRQAGESAGAY